MLSDAVFNITRTPNIVPILRVAFQNIQAVHIRAVSSEGGSPPSPGYERAGASGGPSENDPPPEEKGTCPHRAFSSEGGSASGGRRWDQISISPQGALRGVQYGGGDLEEFPFQ